MISLANHISKLGCNARCRMGIIHHAKSFLGTPELISTNKAFILSLIEYCFPLWTGSPASHLPQPYTMETKAFNIIGISRDEPEPMGLSLHHRQRVGGFSVFFHLLSSLDPSALSVFCPPQESARCTWSTSNPLFVELPR